jgi:hypothetical protein
VTNAPLYLGIDGGATRSRARLRDADGKVLAEASGAAANIHVDFAAAIAGLSALVDEVLGKAGLGDVHRGTIAIGFGLAGFKDGSDETRVAADFPGFRLVRAANDATTALHRRPRRRGRRAHHCRHWLGGDRARSRPRNHHRRARIRARRRRIGISYRPRRGAFCNARV